MQMLPIGIQSFEKLRTDNFVYVDKTQYIEKLLANKAYYFLSRPRRFGKSLFLSTLKAYFEGKKYLFAGLAIDTPDRRWKKYPVIYIDLNSGYYVSVENLDRHLDDGFSRLDKEYGFSYSGPSSGHFAELIKTIFEKTGQKVVILIDEYDKPLIETLNKPELYEDCRMLLKSFYGVLKTCDEYIEFAFVTGVSRFSKVSIFSDLNNLNDISMDREYAGLCGITETEIRKTFAPYVRELADRNGLTEEQCYAKLKLMYDGYHFTSDTSFGVYNPFSLLLCFNKHDFGSYWYSTATPTFLIEELKDSRQYTCERIVEGIDVSVNLISQYDRTVKNPLVLLYQTGYLTIREMRNNIAVLTFPNSEVKFAFAEGLSVVCTKDNNPVFVSYLVDKLEKGDIDGFMEIMQTLFARIPYTVKERRDESYFRNIFFVVFTLMGQYCSAETHTFDGRVDLVVFADTVNYVFEFKFKEGPEAALAQIDDRNYSIAFEEKGKRIVKVGVGNCMAAAGRRKRKGGEGGRKPFEYVVVQGL